MYILNVWGLHVIEQIQSTFHGWGNFFTFISRTVGNPDSLYFFYFPLIYPFDCKLGIKLLQATIVGDWLNLFMKWLLMGDRPYWWIHEAKLADSIHIQQFYNTCETGPGNPSGHVAITGIAWYVLTQAIIDKVDQNFRKNIKYPAWTVYVVALGLLGMSRIYIAAHFPHQCLFGFLFAVLTGRLVSKLDPYALALRHYVLGFIFSLVSVVLLYCALEVLGFDIKWTIKLANKWCTDPSWVHVSTTPFYIMWRCMGLIIGTGLLSTSKTYRSINNLHLSMSKRIFLSIGGVLLSTSLIQFAPKKITSFASYMTVFIFHAVFINVTGIALPLTMQLLNCR